MLLAYQYYRKKKAEQVQAANPHELQDASKAPSSKQHRLVDSQSSVESLIKPQPLDPSFGPEDLENQYGTRTPSPTPEEAEFLAGGGIDWQKLKDWRFWVSKGVLLRLFILAIVIASTVLVSVEHDRFIRWFQPTAHKIKDLHAGFLIPVAILTILSFPPLFGQEIIIMLIGVIYGFWEGFAITAAGTVLGEVANYYTFRYACTARAAKLENKNLRYACFAELFRTGGFQIILIARFSLLPPHFTTVIFAACRVPFIQFLIAVFISLPKQLALVYIGVDYQESSLGTESKRSKTIASVLVIVTGFVTYLCFRYLLSKVNNIKGEVVYRRRKARQAKLRLNQQPSSQSTVSGVYAPRPRAANFDNERRDGPIGPVYDLRTNPGFARNEPVLNMDGERYD